VLRDPERTSLLVQAIAGDVCMKTNPVPLAEGEIRAFVGDVATALETVQP
jgi:hypothetical protein